VKTSSPSEVVIEIKGVRYIVRGTESNGKGLMENREPDLLRRRLCTAKLALHRHLLVIQDSTRFIRPKQNSLLRRFQFATISHQ